MIALSPEIYRMVKKTLFSGANKFLDLKTSKGEVFLCLGRKTMEHVPMSMLRCQQIQRIWLLGPNNKYISPTRLRNGTSTDVRAAVPEARETLAKHMTNSSATVDWHYGLFNQRTIAMPVVNSIFSKMEKSCPWRANTSIHWPRRELLATESASARNKEEFQKEKENTHWSHQKFQTYIENRQIWLFMRNFLLEIYCACVNRLEYISTFCDEFCKYFFQAESSNW